MMPGQASSAGEGILRRTTVIVTVYNRPELLRKCLISLGQQSVLPEELVISDDGSQVDVPGAVSDLVAALPFRVRYVSQPDRGFRLARCRNNGVRAASGELLVFADQDLVFTRNYLKTFAEAAQPGTFLVSWPVRLTAGQTEGVTDEFVRKGEYSELVTPAQAALVRKQFRKDLFYFWMHRLGMREIGPKLRGGIFSVSKADFSSVNGFDEAYQGWGNEDDDLGRRLHRSGVRGRNVFRSEYPIHLFHPPFNAGGARPNLEYYERRVREIRGGDVRGRFGLESPLGEDEVTVKDLR